MSVIEHVMMFLLPSKEVIWP